MLLQAALALPADPVEAGQAATKHYVDARFGAVDTLTIRGALDCSGAPNYPAANTGDVAYIVSVAGRIGGASGINVLQAAMLVCTADGTATSGAQGGCGRTLGDRPGSQPRPGEERDFRRGRGTSRSSTRAPAHWSARAASGSIPTASMAANSDLRMPSQKAVRTAAFGGKPLGGDTPGQGELLLWDGTVASFRAASGGGRNLLVNSTFDIWEEATSYSFGSSPFNVHIADFWNVGSAGYQSKTAARGNGFEGSRFSLRIQRPPGSGDVSHVRIAQQFGREEALFMQGKPLVVSFDMLAGADCSVLGIVAGFRLGHRHRRILPIAAGAEQPACFHDRLRFVDARCARTHRARERLRQPVERAASAAGPKRAAHQQGRSRSRPAGHMGRSPRW